MKNNRFNYLLIMIISMTCINSWAFKQVNSHTHGEAVLNIALEKQIMTIEFISPAMNLTGFEHSLNSEQDKKKVADVRQYLKNAQWLQPNSNAHCQLRKSSVEAHFEDHEDHEDHEHDKENHETNEASDHAEFIANYEYQCLSSDELKTIKLTLFDDYQELHKIRVYLITENKQTTFLLHDDKVIIHLN